MTRPMRDDFGAEPRLDDLYRDSFIEARRDIAVTAVQDAIQPSEAIADSSKRALWLAQLCAWLPEGHRRHPGRAALSVLTSIDDARRAGVAARVLLMLFGLMRRQDLERARVAVRQSLQSSAARSEFDVAVAEVLDSPLPPMDQLLPALATDELRLQALRGMDWEPSSALIRRCLAEGLATFADADLRAAGCCELLRRMPHAESGAVLTTQETERIIELASEAADAQVANETFSWLRLAVGEADEPQIVAGMLRFNRGLLDAAQRARGMFGCIGLGHSDAVNGQFASEGLDALAAVPDEAVRTELIGTYVASIPGTPKWDLNRVLAFAAGVGDQRLRARVLNFAMVLGEIGRRALQAGLEIEDPWARAAVIFGWEGWRGTPTGFTRRQWARTRLKAAQAVPASAARARYLALVAKESKGARRHKITAEAWAAAEDVNNPQQRAQLFYVLAAEGLADRGEAVGQAVPAAWSITDPYRRYDALARIGHLLSPADFVELLRQILGDILENAERLDFLRLCEPPGLDLGIAYD